MRQKTIKLLSLVLLALFFTLPFVNRGQAQKAGRVWAPVVPKTWDNEAMASLEVPLADESASPVHASADYYYQIPVRPIYKSYPIYAPGKEPPGYFERLKEQAPEMVFDAAQLKTENDWIKAGEIVFDAPIAYDFIINPAYVRDAAWYQQTGTQQTKEGIVPFFRYVVREKGKVEVGWLGCAMCHIRVMPDGRAIKGAQGNFPFDRAIAFNIRATKPPLEGFRSGEIGLFGAPWLKAESPEARFATMSLDDFAAAHEAIPPGVIARHRSTIFEPVQVPDLIGVKDRRYLDRTGLQLHRSIADLMRYAALNQGGDDLARYGTLRPVENFFGGRFPESKELQRYSDEQLYALSLYLYALKPPPNPHRFDALAARGRKVFEQQGCAVCHTPPLYTNNKLTPVEGFKVPEEHLKKYDILPITVGTDPTLTMKTRRGTGYYKVPSLKGVWYRGPFEHSGSVATLEDWFDLRRIKDDYTATGFRGVGVKARAVKGHQFGLNLSADDRHALIAFLKTL